jgi:hypothetical protein
LVDVDTSGCVDANQGLEVEIYGVEGRYSLASVDIQRLA